MWRAVAASVAGAGHRARDTGCEDASAIEVADDGTVLIAVADGAGSAARAAEGSAIAIASAMDALRGGAPPCVAVHRARSALADDEGPFEERATTLLVARVDASSVETAQVGDGAVVLRRDGLLEVLAPDAKGEYLNETTFLTSASWRDDLRLASVPAGGIDGVAVLTDGLQLIAFDLVTGAPHGPFFEPFFAFAADGGPEADLARFLGSERVGSRTDDDVTLAVAVRASAPSA